MISSGTGKLYAAWHIAARTSGGMMPSVNFDSTRNAISWYGSFANAAISSGASVGNFSGKYSPRSGAWPASIASRKLTAGDCPLVLRNKSAILFFNHEWTRMHTNQIKQWQRGVHAASVDCTKPVGNLSALLRSGH